MAKLNFAKCLVMLLSNLFRLNVLVKHNHVDYKNFHVRNELICLKVESQIFRIGHWSWMDIFIYFTVSCMFTEASHLSFIAKNVSSANGSLTKHIQKMFQYLVLSLSINPMLFFWSWTCHKLQSLIVESEMAISYL